MKLTLLSVWLCLVVLPAFSQAVFSIDSLPANGLRLDKGWKWHLGDNPDWAKSNFDDSRWNAFNPAQDINLLNQLPQQGIGWLRLRVKIAPELRGKLVSILMRQIGAAELFLNGNPVTKNGKINARGQVENGILNQCLPSILVGNDSLQTIAVRYAFSKERLFGLPFFTQRSFFRMIIAPVEHADTYRIFLKKTFLVEFTLFGIYLILGIIQFIFFLSSRSRITFVYFGLFLILQGATYFLDAFTKDGQPDFTAVTRMVLYDDLRNVVFCVVAIFSTLFYLLGVYAYFNQPKRIPFFITATLTLATIPAYLFSFLNASVIFMLVMGFLVPWTEILRVGIVALRQRRSGAKLFTFSHAFLMATFLVYTLAIINPVISNLLGEVGFAMFAISFLLMALIITLLLSQERADTNRLLQKQLIELEALSQKTITQEQEKQQILANQNQRLEQQVEVRTAELKASQNQLIQKEKLASLGELTAGIAHEIQNPLNFVNNFSELSVELVEELKVERLKVKEERDEALENELLDDLAQNQEKINHHGKRASSIVKGMLEHSRTGSGEQVATDLNKLADEYLRLSYHGMKAKNNHFQADFELIADPNLPFVNIVPQEIGRVLLNLFNNAFYAVGERAKKETEAYFPKVKVVTSQTADAVTIQVQDNGGGIPESVKAKIFQPFFTTKPTGEGTGLGLSLSHDIITKGYGGMMEVESVEGERTTFIIKLPIHA